MYKEDGKTIGHMLYRDYSQEPDSQQKKFEEMGISMGHFIKFSLNVPESEFTKGENTNFSFNYPTQMSLLRRRENARTFQI